MKSLTIKPPKTVIQRWATILFADRQCVGTVMDIVPGHPRTPKRIRIQRGPAQGHVVQPGDYQFVRWLDETEVDD